MIVCFVIVYGRWMLVVVCVVCEICVERVVI